MLLGFTKHYVAIALPAVLAGALGVGWSKDNLRTADRCYVDPSSCGAGGTDCDCASGVNQDQRIVGEFAMQLQQTALRAHLRAAEGRAKPIDRVLENLALLGEGASNIRMASTLRRVDDKHMRTWSDMCYGMNP